MRYIELYQKKTLTIIIFEWQNDCAKMSEVWVRMQEEAFVPSDDLKRKMAVPFIKEGKQAPFAVPLQSKYLWRQSLCDVMSYKNVKILTLVSQSPVVSLSN